MKIPNIEKLLRLKGYKLEKYLEEQRFYPITEVRSDDIFVAGFPKSGNTWMQNLVSGIVFGIDTRYLPDRLTQELVPDVHYKKYYKRYLNFSVFKTHELPKPEYRRVVHLVRDGRDAMASYYAMNRALNEEVTLAEMIVEGKKVFPCKWHEHTKAWMENQYDADILRIRYEDLVANPVREMSRFCAFAGIHRSPETIWNAISGNDFSAMQEKEKTYGINNKRWNKNHRFFRRGRVGSHQDEIPGDLLAHFTAESREYLIKMGYPVEN